LSRCGPQEQDSFVRILIDITHPAHVHFFRNAIGIWRERGHEVCVVARRKDIAVALLERFGLDHDDLGPASGGLWGLGRELLLRGSRLCGRVRRLRPDVVTAVGGVFVAPAAWVCRVPSVIFYDTENATWSNRLTFPLCTTVATPDCYEGMVTTKRHRTYRGYHELAYTHPRRFMPDRAKLTAFGLHPDEPFVVLRLVAWKAAHDLRDHGFTSVEEVVRELERFARVVISSEAEVPPDLADRRLLGPPELVHHLLAHARLYIGESATMASESATLGTPAILVSTSRRGYTDEQERRYGLTYTFSHRRDAEREALAKAVAILSDPLAKSRWEEKRQRMLGDKIDVTSFIVELVESHGRRG
jgi:predicted glycosyltransferase